MSDQPSIETSPAAAVHCISAALTHVQISRIQSIKLGDGSARTNYERAYNLLQDAMNEMVMTLTPEEMTALSIAPDSLGSYAAEFGRAVEATIPAQERIVLSVEQVTELQQQGRLNLGYPG
ncbi:MAG: hypothetical protein OXL97_09065 [Chloroflexota bacterium]|nr:hypothetical protein [Chloroflexota bacterium]MDE2883490.1 hypothetical protein [Chloroflexota bacterium]